MGAGLEEAGLEKVGLEKAGLEEAGLEEAGLEQASSEASLIAKEYEESPTYPLGLPRPLWHTPNWG